MVIVKENFIMRRLLVTLFMLIAFVLGVQNVNAACSCKMQACPCSCTNITCEDFLCPENLENYLCKIGLNECQKEQARVAISQFLADTQCLRANGYKCETKCECRAYRKALRDLDCKMKNIITKCQQEDYKCVRTEVKDQVKCCHKCLINPFKRCKCACR